MSAVCGGHRCDGCARCLAGECCGADVAEANLPAEGAWPTPLHAPIGELVDKGGRVMCHLCGTWHVLLAQHLRHVHKLTADAYRAIAGLKAQLTSEHQRAAARARWDRPTSDSPVATARRHYIGGAR